MSTTSKLGADMTDRERFEADLLAYFKETQPDRTLTLDAIKEWRGESGDYAGRPIVRGMWEGWQRALLARQPAAIDKEASIPEEVRHALTHAIGGWRGAACGTRDDEEGDRRSADYRRRAQVIEDWLAASTSANVAQTVSEKCARLAELYRDEHAMSGQEEEICNAIAEACRDYGSTNVAQGAEAVVLQHVAVAEDGGKLRWMSGRRPRDCELYAMHDGGRIPPKLYAAPPAQTALTDDARDAAFERYADALLAISRYAKYTPGTAVEMCRIAHKALYKNAAQSASGDTK